MAEGRCMQRRAPGRLTETPHPGWSGALVAGVTVVTVLAFALTGGVAVAATNRSSKRKARSSPVLASPVRAPTRTGDASSEGTGAVGAPYAVRTVTVSMYDAARDRTINATIYAPDTDGEFPLVVMVHGYAAAASDYETLDTEVAAAGFVVAAPDFPESSRAVTTSPSRDIVAPATDLAFVPDQLPPPATGPPPFVGPIAG